MIIICGGTTEGRLAGSVLDEAGSPFFYSTRGALQQVEGNLIYPHVVGSSVGLPSIWVLAAVSTGGSLMGVAGMLLFIPLTSVVYTLFRQLVYQRLKENGVRVK